MKRVLCSLLTIFLMAPATAGAVEMEAGTSEQLGETQAGISQVDISGNVSKARKIARKSTKTYKKLRKQCKKARSTGSRNAYRKAAKSLKRIRGYLAKVKPLGHESSYRKVRKHCSKGSKLVAKARRSLKAKGSANTSMLAKLRSNGVVYSGGWRYTWYSQLVLPGGGLGIPGRHVGLEGAVMDGNGRICVASSSHARGAIISTPFGTAKVYDTGCPGGTIDVYTNW